MLFVDALMRFVALNNMLSFLLKICMIQSWKKVNSEFEGFARYVATISKKDSLPRITQSVSVLSSCTNDVLFHSRTCFARFYSNNRNIQCMRWFWTRTTTYSCFWRQRQYQVCNCPSPLPRVPAYFPLIYFPSQNKCKGQERAQASWERVRSRTYRMLTRILFALLKESSAKVCAVPCRTDSVEGMEKDHPYEVSLETGGKFNVNGREGINLLLVPGDKICQVCLLPLCRANRCGLPVTSPLDGSECRFRDAMIFLRDTNQQRFLSFIL